MKVAVISVVGNFRTGKSFLLSFMVRFLRNSHLEGGAWQTAEVPCVNSPGHPHGRPHLIIPYRKVRVRVGVGVKVGVRVRVLVWLRVTFTSAVMP